MLNGTTPVFSNFGTDVYASDLTRGAIRCIATEISKLNPQHIRTDRETGIQQTVHDEINRLFQFGPNPYMSTSDFLSKLVFLREKYNNVYIYPAWERVELGQGKYKRRYTGFYPLNPVTTEYLEDESGGLWIRFGFSGGYEYSLPYEDIIHWRKDYMENEYQGGDANGEPDVKSELELLQSDHTIMQGIQKGTELSMTLRGIVKENQMMLDEDQEERRKVFERKLKNSESGIISMDMKADYIPLNIDPKFVDKDTIEFVVKRILANRGVPLPIYNGTFTEEEYQAFYEKTLEHQIISLGRAFSRTLFTERELELGNEIIFYNQGLMFTNTSNKIKSVDILTRIGVLTDNEVRNIFGYPPFEGGDIRHISLNYINREIADEYQMSGNRRITEVSYGKDAGGDTDGADAGGK